MSKLELWNSKVELMTLHNHGVALMYYAAALSTAKTFEEAYEALHFIAQRVMVCEDITDNVPQALLGYVNDEKKMPEAIAVELRGINSKLITRQ
jgi:hypothetical protein